MDNNGMQYTYHLTDNECWYFISSIQFSHEFWLIRRIRPCLISSN